MLLSKRLFTFLFLVRMYQKFWWPCFSVTLVLLLLVWFKTRTRSSDVFLSLDTFLCVLANRVTEEKPGWCSDPHLPPCAAYALSLPPWFKVELMYCNIIYLDFLFFLYLVNFTISFVILDLWKLWHLSFLVRLGVVCGTWFRYILFSLLHMMAMVT